jgi:hypothetical protein
MAEWPVPGGWRVAGVAHGAWRGWRVGVVGWRGARLGWRVVRGGVGWYLAQWRAQLRGP